MAKRRVALAVFSLAALLAIPLVAGGVFYVLPIFLQKHIYPAQQFVFAIMIVLFVGVLKLRTDAVAWLIAGISCLAGIVLVPLTYFVTVCAVYRACL